MGPEANPPLRPDALTIGFARRFATYKRATLLFRDVGRLKAILLNETRPVQLLLSGKAHPRDGAGKEFIREMLDIVKREGLQRQRGVPRRLRPEQGRHAGPGRRRVAQHPAAPLRSVAAPAA